MTASLDIVVPVLNEERGLVSSINKLHAFATSHLSQFKWTILIADNGSTDSTKQLCIDLSSDLSNVDYIYLKQRGRGRALKKAWLGSEADIMCYMDVDLSTDLVALPHLVSVLETGEYDLCIGSRLGSKSTVIGRKLKRELISRIYNLMIRMLFCTRFQDAQCGFKAVSKNAAGGLVPFVKDNAWFFDTELLILAEKNGYRIKELPVIWTDDPDSKVRILKTALEDLKGLARLRFGGLRQASNLILLQKEQSHTNP
ncbi:MAG: dolichyl-phosphate beta-glucosyltransferase [Chloroflexota bacterium]|nr:dolichyl-phosphate beta-glucosyltransferase [Chloroflexota bacterium]|tara:strand:- start:250 stop:1017 length:768 start_codon:yes stop_codon:yes gene_type:complete